MFVLEIHPDKIKDIIGPGGKVINKIVAETGAKVDIENDGRVFISSPDAESGEKAKRMVEDIARDVEVGEVYTGVVKRIMNFGAFVQILPGKEGLVHISQLAPHRVARVEDEVKIGDEVIVRVAEIDSQGRINLTRKGLMPEEAKT
jgi:polyribonucleotide nucleotidyltransferase